MCAKRPPLPEIGQSTMWPTVKSWAARTFHNMVSYLRNPLIPFFCATPMLPYFPAPAPDELLYSLLARYHRHTCSVSPKATMRDLFGQAGVRATTDLPGHLEVLAQRLPASLGLGALKLAQSLTLLPYHVALRSRDAALAAFRAMASGTTTGLHLRLGLGALSARRPLALRYCPACHESSAVAGDRYWSRAHQLPGVLVCPLHGEPLFPVPPDVPPVGQHAFLAAEDVGYREQPAPAWSRSDASMGLLRRIAVESAACLEVPLFQGEPLRRADLLERCAATGLMRSEKQADQAAIERRHAHALAPLKGILCEADDFAWLMTMVRKTRCANRPLQAILFGLVMDHPGEHRRPRTKPSERQFLKEDPSFARSLGDAVSAGFGLRATARALGVDPTTVRKHAARLGLSCSWARPKPDHPGRVLSPPPAYGDWLAAMAELPGASKTELRRRAPGTYSWLYRHDPEWLAGHSPARAVRAAPGYQVNWGAEDLAICARLDGLAHTLRAEDPPRRITLAALERGLGKPRWISDRKAKLPLTVARVAGLAEAVGAFQLRRLAWAQAELERCGRTAPVWKVRRRAGVAPGDDAGG